jgi:hypothetical protein
MVSRAFWHKLIVNESMRIGVLLLSITNIDLFWLVTHTNSTLVIIIGSLISFIRILLDGTMIIAINEYQQTLLKIWSYLAIPGLFCRLFFNIILKVSIHQNYQPKNSDFNDPNWWFNIMWFIIVLDLCLRYFGLVNVNITLNEIIRVDNENAATMELQPLVDPKELRYTRG